MTASGRAHHPHGRGPTVRVSGLVMRAGRVLLVQQRRAAAHYWLLPGGHVHPGESLVEALRREVMEECGLKVEPLVPAIGLVESISPDRGISRHVLQLVLAARLGDDREPAALDPTVVSVGWFTLSQLDDLVIHPPIPDLLGEWMRWFGSEVALPLPPVRWGGVRWADE